MPSFKLYTSNKSELLLDALSEVVKVPHSPLLTPEFIIVQNKGMERWISLELSRKLGIWGNCRYFFPNEFVEYLFSLTFPTLPDRSIFEPRFLTWKIMEILPSMLDRDGFESLKNYLSDGRQLKLYQISSLIADTFDQYSMYRPQMVREWDSGKDSQWQAVLWRAIFSGSHSSHRSQLQSQFLANIASGAFGAALGPKRISMFGISSLPTFHREIILSLSSFLDVHLFLLNPCNEFWDDVLSEKEIYRISHSKGKKINPQDDLHWETGNRFLASMGSFGRDFLSDLHSSDGEEYFLFSEPDSSSILSCLQADILHLRERAPSDSPTHYPQNDYSIQVHSCHSPLREIEVLYDNLLGLFEKIPDLTPSDIVVMTPDISLYAPFIHAVFGNPKQKQMTIPFSVADRRQDSESPVISTFLSLLSLVRSRCTAGEIISILESEHVRHKFSLSEDDVSQIRIWVSDARIYWGLDEKHRSTFISPSCPDNTWKSGIDRMLLGYALARDNISLFEGIAPFEAIEGGQAQVLGRFLDFYSCLTDLIESISINRTLNEWSAFLLGKFACFFPDDDESISRDTDLIKNNLRDFSSIQTACNLSGSIDFETVYYILSSSLAASRNSSGFLTGSTTFCEMLPMRSIPFRIICLLGMNDGVFPRKTRRPSWDLIGTNPRKGDRSLEKEDRYIFLEALLCSRDVFYISFIGQDIKDNSAHQPSVAVMELLDLIDRTYYIRPGADGGNVSVPPSDHSHLPPSSRLLVRHRLQAFSPFYFTHNSPLTSYSKENYSAALSLVNSAHSVASQSFFPEALPEPGPEWLDVAVDDLCDFFSHPVRFLLKKRLGISLSDSQIELHDKEPFTLEGLNGYEVGQLLLTQFIRGQSRESCLSFLKAQGMLPHGNSGLCAFAGLADEVADFVRSIASQGLSAPGQTVAIHGRLGDFSITGSISGYSFPMLCRYRFGNKKPRDILTLWINTLVLAALAPEIHSEGGIFAGRDGIWEIRGIENASSLLKDALDIYRLGLSRPLPFFPRASWTFAERMLVKKDSPDSALREALKVWIGSEFNQGEITDEYLSLCHAQNPELALGEEFRSSTVKILAPLFSYLREKQP